MSAILRTIAVLIAVLIMEIIVAPTTILGGLLVWLGTGFAFGSICDALHIGMVKR